MNSASKPPRNFIGDSGSIAVANSFSQGYKLVDDEPHALTSCHSRNCRPPMSVPRRMRQTSLAKLLPTGRRARAHASDCDRSTAVLPIVRRFIESAVAMPGRFRNLAGQKFNRLTVVRFAGRRQFSSGRESTWQCRCDCGSELVVPQRYIVTNGTKSCGCLIGQHKRTHGMTNTPTFRIWDGMLRRCRNSFDARYPMYGGRGISVCERWLKFENFLADMGEKPKGLSLDRIDNDGNYQLSNCRWTTMRVQSNNRRSNKTLTISGVTRTYAEWERASGLKPGCVHQRLAYGWSAERAVSPPVYRRGVERVKALPTS
jgi:hypothetical protein